MTKVYSNSLLDKSVSQSEPIKFQTLTISYALFNPLNLIDPIDPKLLYAYNKLYKAVYINNFIILSLSYPILSYF